MAIASGLELRQLPNPNPFEFVDFDREHAALSLAFRDQFIKLYRELQRSLPKCRSTSVALTKLEESSIWVNKAIRDSQIDWIWSTENKANRS